MSDVVELVSVLRARGVTVHEWDGWNGRTNNRDRPHIEINGAIIHHTGSNYGGAYEGLVRSTQAWARGNALCNFAGNSDGSLTVIATGVTWHAGGGFGPNQGPLAPYAANRNYYTVGLEIVYPGNSPMTPEQYKTATKFAKAVADTFCGGDIEYVRGHGEVNGIGQEGKWDPGYKPGQMIDMDKFRADAIEMKEADDMALTPDDGNVEWSVLDPYNEGKVETHKVADWVGLAAIHSAENALKLQRLEDKVDAIALGGVDINALADALIARIDVDLVKK